MRVAQDGRPGHDERLGLDQIPGYGRDPAQSERFRLEQEAEYVSNLHKVIVSNFLPSFIPSLLVSLPPCLPPCLPFFLASISSPCPQLYTTVSHVALVGKVEKTSGDP